MTWFSGLHSVVLFFLLRFLTRTVLDTSFHVIIIIKNRKFQREKLVKWMTNMELKIFRVTYLKIVNVFFSLLIHTLHKLLHKTLFSSSIKYYMTQHKWLKKKSKTNKDRKEYNYLVIPLIWNTSSHQIHAGRKQNASHRGKGTWKFLLDEYSVTFHNETNAGNRWWRCSPRMQMRLMSLSRALKDD
jgi:hypothetical protein